MSHQYTCIAQEQDYTTYLGEIHKGFEWNIEKAKERCAEEQVKVGGDPFGLEFGNLSESLKVGAAYTGKLLAMHEEHEPTTHTSH